MREPKRGPGDVTARASFLPYGRHAIDESDIAAVVDVLRGDFLTTGPAVAAFEAALAARVGAREAVACSSGTAALHLAALALDIGPGDVVVVPAMTFLATANAVRMAGAEVAFADVDPDTGLMAPAHVEDAIARAGPRDSGHTLKAIFNVHLNGQTGDVVGLRAAADRHRLALVEDASHAVGAAYDGPHGASLPVGGCAHADLATFSFHPVKAIAMGEGGAVTTNDAGIAARLRRLRNHGMVREADRFEQRALAFDDAGAVNPWYYEMAELGYNYRASDLHCALGASQLARLDAFVARRRELIAHYRAALAPLAPIVRLVPDAAGAMPAWHLCVALIDFDAAGLSRAAVMAALRDAGIGTQVHYLPLHLQPYYRGRYGPLALPGAEAYYASALSLPLFPAMADSDVERVAEALQGLIGQ